MKRTRLLMLMIIICPMSNMSTKGRECVCPFNVIMGPLNIQV